MTKTSRKQAILEERLKKLRREGQDLQRRRSFWNAVLIDRRLDDLRAEYKALHAEWKALTAQKELF